MDIKLPQYKCHKVVHAVKIKAIAYKPNPDETGRSAASSYGAVIAPEETSILPFDVPAEFVNKHNPHVGGYYVVYEDGYASFSPANAFEEGYTLIPADHRDRVRAEAVELTAKTNAPGAFLVGDFFNTLGGDEKARLLEQHRFMWGYLNTLQARIAAFDTRPAVERQGVMLTEDPDHGPADHSAAVAALQVAAETCETNAPIHEAEGNVEQAALSRSNAQSYRAAIETLQA